jgi:GAF domain-containing protein
MHDPLRATPWTAVREGGGRWTLYEALIEELDALLRGEADPVANAANAAAAIYHSLPELNWAGFYFLRGEELVLGPFQGKPACVRIPLGRGVCGAAAARRRSVLVPDVWAFPGHIACDTASRAELVVPLLTQTGPTEAGVLGVLDLDSPVPGRFDAADQAGCEAIAAMLVRHLAPALSPPSS